jgi:trans-aconitate 2-methyltransferase
MNDNKVRDFYDDFSEKQIITGVSTRNIKIHEFAIKFGLKKTDNILEIGCGIGTQTGLLAEYTKGFGKITAIDISEKSVEYAKNDLKKFNNVNFLTGDIVEMKLDFNNKFDVVILPDVIEHVPIENHYKLFAILRLLLKDAGFIIIHIPNPNFLEWRRKNRKELLQVIDQPIYTNELCLNIYPNDLYIHYLETYEIWQKNCDYQVIILKVKKAANEFPEKIYTSTFIQKAVYKIKLVLGLNPR